MTEPIRTLTPLEHDRAWHAIEGAEDPDPGTILAAVLHALRIAPPTVEDEQAASSRLRDAARTAAARQTTGQTDTEPTRVGRCPVMFQGGGRCEKDADHRAGRWPDDPHTPEPAPAVGQPAEAQATDEATAQCWRADPHPPHTWTWRPEEGGADCPGLRLGTRTVLVGKSITEAPLTAAERQFLTFALDLADNRMANRSDEFTSEDYQALAALRRMAEEARS